MSIEIAIAWGDYPLCRRVLSPGEQLDVPGTDMRVIAHAHRVSLVSARGHEEQLTAGDVVSVGALSIALEPASASQFEHSKYRSDVLGALVLFTYFAVVLQIALAQATVSSTMATPRRPAQAGTSRLRSAGRPAPLRLQLAPDWRAVPRAAPPPQRTDAAMALLPEAPTPERGPHVVAHRTKSALADRRLGGRGARAKRDEGPMGNPYAPDSLGRWAKPDAFPFRSRKVARRAHPGGLEYWANPIGLDSTRLARDWHPDATEEGPHEAVFAPFGEERGIGPDSTEVLGNMFGPEPIDPVGSALGQTGHGLGGGGRARSIGMGAHGSLGHGSGRGADQGAGMPLASPFRRDRSPATHATRAPSLDTRAAAAAVRRILARESMRLRACTGSSIRITFTVGTDGHARGVTVVGANGAQAKCVDRILDGLPFPTASTPTTITQGLR